MVWKRWIAVLTLVLLAVGLTACQKEMPEKDGEEGKVVAVVPILMYHAFTEDPDQVDDMTALASDFEEHLQALARAGYQFVTCEDLLAYARGEGDLPEKPILLTMDDGYRDNLTLAAPLLEQYGATANIAVIGVSIGRETYKDTGVAMTPHFSLQEALPWVERGIVSLTTHSYDLHQVPALDGEDCRKGVLPLAGESEDAYIAVLTGDYETAIEQLDVVLTERLPVYTYPQGRYTHLTEETLRGLGVEMTLTTDPGVNEIRRGDPDSLYGLKRLHVPGGMDAEDLLSQLSAALP